MEILDVFFLSTDNLDDKKGTCITSSKALPVTVIFLNVKKFPMKK